MKRLSCLWICLFLLPFHFVAGESIRVATYNLNNYLLTDRHVDGVWRPNYPKPESEKRAIRQVIRHADPDVLAIQEVGSASFLEELRRDLAMEGLDYPYAFHLETEEDSNRQIALLSKLEPQEIEKHTDLEFNYQPDTEKKGRSRLVKRGMLEAVFNQPNGVAFKLFLVHLKSRYTTDKADPESRKFREKEAKACRNRIIERTFDLKQNAFLILGDFNDDRDSDSLQRFYKRGDLEIASLLPAVDSRDHLWTYYYKKSATYSLFDMILFSEGIAGRIQSRKGRIVDGPDSLVEGSDHRMVFVDILFNRDSHSQVEGTSFDL